MSRRVAAALFVCLGASVSASAQDVKVDFVRDVQPIFRQHCLGCHGPSQQMNGFRLDRRKDAMRGGTIAVIGPGNSDASRLYLRVAGSHFGPQMPPTGALNPDQIKTIKDWIDQGAHWPDEASGEVAAAPPDLDATRLVQALRRGDLQTFRAALKTRPAAAGLKGPGGVTPLMAATLYADLDSMRLLLNSGADTNVRNESGATALMWAVTSLEKTQLLIERGADVNAKSDDKRTALMIASGLQGAAPVVKLLLDRGADLKATAAGLFGETSALLEAILAGDEATFRLLVDRGADVKAALPFGVLLARKSGCRGCEATLLAATPPPLMGVIASLFGPPLDDARAMTEFLERGADANSKDREGRSLLMLAASSDAVPVDAVRALLQKGADVHLRTPGGETALSLARLRGQTAIVDLLVKAGAKADPEPALPKPSPAASVRAAIERSIPLLQKSDVAFMRKSGCVSCHNNSITAMATSLARRRAIPVDRNIATAQAKAIGEYLESWRDRVLQGNGIPGDSDTISYLLLGLAAENYQSDAATDAMTMFLKNKQTPQGQWRVLAHRPPIESSDIEVTAVSMRALQVYAPAPLRMEYQRAIDRAGDWLKKATPRHTEDRAFQLLGLLWADAARPAIAAAAKALLAEQRPDGGWAQIPSLPSDAYATGQALVALAESGAVPIADPAYQRGVQFLLKNQLADGSWYVRTRAIPIQPLFNADFPHGKDAFVSAAATGWATMALSLGAVTN